MITSIDAEKAFGKIQQLCITKAISKQGTESYLLNLIGINPKNL